ncbi:MAG: Hsp33 family molecular chaperone HslO [Clostridia bacterium]|nr:Hsp33 family molecular chaperone HslO [Clostridia bacterium]
MGNLVRAMTSDGSARILALDSTDIVKRAAEIHGDTLAVNLIMGRVLTAASLMGSLLGDKKDLLTVTFKGDGEVGTVLASSDYMGNVRGYIANPFATVSKNEDGKIDISSAIGEGILQVLRDVGEGEPYSGISVLKKGDISSDIASYYAESEQIPTVCVFSVAPDSSGKKIISGGIIIQLLPFADEALIDVLEKNLQNVRNISEILESGTVEDIISEYLKGVEYDIFDKMESSYKCYCSKEKTDRALISLGKEELTSLINDDIPTEITCRFCDKKYNYSKEDLKELFEQAK